MNKLLCENLLNINMNQTEGQIYEKQPLKICDVKLKTLLDQKKDVRIKM